MRTDEHDLAPGGGDLDERCRQVDAAEPLAALPAGSRGRTRRPVGAVIGDDARLAGVLVRSLQRSGCRVVHAGDGPEGLAVFAAMKPDLVLCDVGLPGLDGRAVCRQLRRRVGSPPVILMSGHCSFLDRQAAIGAGAAEFLAKPFGRAELIAAVASLIASSL